MSAVVTQQSFPIMPEPANLMDVITRAASDPNIDVGKVEKLMEMYERIQAKNAEAAFNAAMTGAQSEMGRISADATNPQTRSNYASYGKLDSVLRPIYTKHGFALSFDEGESIPDHVLVLCNVSHNSGHSRIYRKLMPADGKGAKGGDVMTKTHASGAAMSYGMRYLLKGIFNVAIGEEDNDGNGAKLPRITEKQAADIRALITEIGVDQAKFLKYMQASSVEEIPAQAFKDAVAALEKRRSKA